MAVAAPKIGRRESEEELDISFSVNPRSKRLLDVIVSILADEYIQAAKENPEIFSDPKVSQE